MNTVKQNITVLPTKIISISGATAIGNEIKLGVPSSGTLNGGYVSGLTPNTFITDAIDQINKQLTGLTATELSKSVYTFTTTDWVGPTSGYYTLSNTTHGKGNYPTLHIEELISTKYYAVSPDSIQIANNGDITLYVVDNPDGRFPGRIIII